MASNSMKCCVLLALLVVASHIPTIARAQQTNNSTDNLTNTNGTNSTDAPVETDAPSTEDELGSLKWVIFGVVAAVVGIPLLCLCLYFVQRNHAQRQRMLEVQEQRQISQTKRGDNSAQRADHDTNVFDFNYTPSTKPLPERSTFIGHQLEEFDENVLRPPSDSSSQKFGSSTSSANILRKGRNHGSLNQKFGTPNHSGGSGNKLTSPSMNRIPSPHDGGGGNRVNAAPPPMRTTTRVPLDDDVEDFELDGDDHHHHGPTITPSSAISASEVSIRNNKSRE